MRSRFQEECMQKYCRCHRHRTPLTIRVTSWRQHHCQSLQVSSQKQTEAGQTLDELEAGGGRQHSTIHTLERGSFRDRPQSQALAGGRALHGTEEGKIPPQECSKCQ